MVNQPLISGCMPALNPEATPDWQALERLVGHYARDFDMRQAFAAYAQRFQQHSLRRLLAYLQQLEMESNDKQLTKGILQRFADGNRQGLDASTTAELLNAACATVETQL